VWAIGASAMPGVRLAARAVTDWLPGLPTYWFNEVNGRARRYFLAPTQVLVFIDDRGVTGNFPYGLAVLPD